MKIEKAPRTIRKMIEHCLKFNLVGALGFAVQVGVLYALTHGVFHVHYLVATATAVESAVLNNFFWHQRWTWNDRPSSSRIETLGRLAKFQATNGAFSLTGNLILMNLLTGWLRFPVTIANAASVIICSIGNFLLADRIAFRIAAMSGK